MNSDGLLGPAQVRALANQLDLKPSKRHGQNFVIDPNTVRRIVQLARVAEGDCVLEVGPGLGSLTLGLLGVGARVLAIEIDAGLAAQLPVTVSEMLPERVGALRVLPADALEIPLPIDAELPTSFVANLPYNIAVPVLLRLLAGLPTIATGLVMVQSEVCDRLVAPPGSRTYGVPSVKIQWFGRVERAGSVGPKVFWPEPRVDSGLVRFRRAQPPPTASTREQVFSCIDAAFSQRRKTLRAALATWAGSAPRAEEILVAAGVSPGARGEVLTLPEFVAITDARWALAAT